jgi:hypothetical protein
LRGISIDREKALKKKDLFSDGNAPLEQGFEVALPEDLEVI